MVYIVLHCLRTSLYFLKSLMLSLGLRLVRQHDFKDRLDHLRVYIQFRDVTLTWTIVSNFIKSATFYQKR